MPLECPRSPLPRRPRACVCQAACGARCSQPSGLKLGVGGVAAPGVGSPRESFAPVFAPLAVRPSHWPTGLPSWRPRLWCSRGPGVES